MTSSYTSPLIEDLEQQILAAKVQMDAADLAYREAYDRWYTLALEKDRLAAKIGHPAASKRFEKRSHDAYVAMESAREASGKAFPVYYKLIDQRDALLPKRR